MALLSFSGTDLIAQDDLTASPWSDTADATTTLLGSARGPATFAAYTVTVDDPGNPGFQAVRALNITSASETDHEVWVWCRAGTATTWEGGLNASGWHVQSAEILIGPGSAEVTSARVVVRGLEAETWTLVKFTDNLASAVTTGDLIIYPGTLSQSAGDSIILGPCRVAVASDAADWVWDSLVPKVSNAAAAAPALALTGAEYANASSPNSNIAVARSQTWLFRVSRGSSSAMTVAEKWQDSNNYWRLQVAADGSIVFNCLLSSSNIGASSAASTVAVGDTVDIACVIPATGSCLIYVNGVDVTSTTAGTLSTAGTGLSVGARYDGSEAWTGNLYPFAAIASEMSNGQAALATLLQDTETPYADGQTLYVRT